MTLSNLENVAIELSTKELLASMQTTGFFDSLYNDEFIGDLDMTFHTHIKDYAILANQMLGFENYNLPPKKL